jgi:uncharacterized membrane-anchored protein
MLFLLGVLFFAVCMIIQSIALHRRAFGRSLFISSMMFLVSGIIALSPERVSGLLARIFLAVSWGFLLFMTWQSLRRFVLARNSRAS